ncbi:MAG: hypothetical protein ACRDVD_01365 [Acidimicrobiia bacterium]
MRTVSLVAVAVLAVACTGNGDGAPAGRLVVTGPDGALTLVDPQGGEPEVLSEGSRGAVPVQATASPDGETLVWSDVAPDGETPVLKVHDQAGTRELESPTVPFYYAFAPAGVTVAALGNDPEGAGVALLIIDLGRDSVELVDVGQPYYLDWAPDGARFAVHIGADVLALVDHDGQRTGVAARAGPFSAPAWTDDGRIVAVVATDQVTASAASLQTATFNVTLIDPDNGSTEMIADVEEAVAFEVAGDRIAVLEGDSGVGPLTVLTVDGSESVEVARDVVAFEWSPGGDVLLFYTLAEATFVPHVWDGEEVTDYPGFVPTPILLTQYLPFWAQYTRTITQWSPDSSAFAYAAVPEGGEDGEGTVWVQPLQGDAEEMGSGEMVIWTP